MATPARSRPSNLVIGVLVTLVIALVVGIVALTRADSGDRFAEAVVTATPSAAPSGASHIAFADCSHTTFGAALAPLNQPRDPHTYAKAPAMTIDTGKLYLMTITTSLGKIGICLQPKLAPATVNVIVTLVRNHYYDGIPFHRVVPVFVAQGGDPSCVGNAPPSPSPVTGACGQGGPGFEFKDEAVRQSYVEGAVAMANSGPNTNGSQFFICIANDTTALTAAYNLFGKVTSGMPVALKVAQGTVMTSVTVQEQQ